VGDTKANSGFYINGCTRGKNWNRRNGQILRTTRLLTANHHYQNVFWKAEKLLDPETFETGKPVTHGKTNAEKRSQTEFRANIPVHIGRTKEQKDIPRLWQTTSSCGTIASHPPHCIVMKIRESNKGPAYTETGQRNTRALVAGEGKGFFRELPNPLIRSTSVASATRRE